MGQKEVTEEGLVEGGDFIHSGAEGVKYGRNGEGNLIDYGEIWGGDEDCIHEVHSGFGGGIRCIKCRAWFCF